MKVFAGVGSPDRTNGAALRSLESLVQDAGQRNVIGQRTVRIVCLNRNGVYALAKSTVDGQSGVVSCRQPSTVNRQLNRGIAS